MKEVKGWELSDENNTGITKHFSEATTDDIMSYIQPTVSNNPEFIVLQPMTWGKTPVQLKLARKI